ncbi:hypothetical protein HPY28_16825 [Brevibacillus sp. HB1.2]|uniref:RHS repeat-associated core domain-containing protein n=1 Tax=Brevibacillus sp. HB1.2 TaxID=2738807 RepID=UPI001575DBD3|nr:RHS repeat-associated core domain-containing protein [Brevibacillus sp. HB1.2]NTU21991.1 hypothetical protein [Brevibacillus sp. HB1.2]
MRARYYHPGLKRFLNRDVLQGDMTDGQTFNRFAYVNGDPIGFIDPLGLMKCKDEKGKSQTRTEIMEIVRETLSPEVKKIKKLDPNAKVGYRGSLATRRKGRHKGYAPFDPTDFDIDAFIVSDKLASRFNPDVTWRAGTEIREIRQIQKEVDKTLRGSLKGLRKFDKKGRPDKFTFRIFTEEEFANQYRKGSKIID